MKTKLVSMGFQEMRGSLVETEFWNMDALFMPQFHPARDIHDVYFVKEPTHATSIAEPFFSRVAKRIRTEVKPVQPAGTMHSMRSARSRLVLRSQGTAVSARTLAAQPAVPGNIFPSPAVSAMTKSMRRMRPTSSRWKASCSAKTSTSGLCWAC